MRERLLELAAKCEAAQGPDRELDARIWWETYARHRQADNRQRWQANPAAEASRAWKGWEDRDEIPHFTASLDAAMTLKGEGRAIINIAEDGITTAIVDGTEATAFTPALALCAASLRSLANQED